MRDSRFIKPIGVACVIGVGAAAVQATDLGFIVPKGAVPVGEKMRDASLTNEELQDEKATAQDVLAAAQADYARLVGALYAQGYYGGTVNILVDGKEAAEIPPLGNPETIRSIRIHVNPGAPYRFTQAQVAPLPPETELPEGFRRGKRAYGELIRTATDAGVKSWRDAGFAKVDVARQDLLADDAAHSMAADIRLAPGPRLRFGRNIVPSGSAVRGERIRQIAGLPSGAIYAPEELKDAAERLRRTGAFKSVTMSEAEHVSPGRTLDITTDVVDAKPRRFGVGLELHSIEGFAFSGFWMHRNLFGGAEKLRFDIRVSGVGGDSGGEDYYFDSRYERPATFTPDTTLYYTVSLKDEDEPTYREQGVRIGGGLSHRFTDDLIADIGGAYQYSRIEDDLGEREMHHLMLPMRLTWDKRDNELNPKNGWYVDTQAEPFLGLEGSDSGARLYVDGRGYYSLGREDGITLAGRAQLGTIAGASIDGVPPGMLFYSGGAGTVRGQSYQSLTAMWGGVETGGRSFAGFSAELRGDVTDSIQAVGFADTGYISRDAWGAGDGKWHSGAGLGVRYMTGIGPIRLDVATPMDDDAGKDFEVYIGIGQAF